MLTEMNPRISVAAAAATTGGKVPSPYASAMPRETVPTRATPSKMPATRIRTKTDRFSALVRCVLESLAMLRYWAQWSQK